MMASRLLWIDNPLRFRLAVSPSIAEADPPSIRAKRPDGLYG